MATGTQLPHDSQSYKDALSANGPPHGATVSDCRGFKGLPPFVDVVFGAVLGFGVFKIEEAIRKAGIPARGNQTPLFLLIVTNLYLVFDYAQSRMCTEKYCYKTLTRYALDVFTATAFVFAYVEAYQASPHYLLALFVLLLLGALWILSLDKEYPKLINTHLLIHTHLWPAVLLFMLWTVNFYGAIGGWFDAWVNIGVGSAFLLYSFVLSLLTGDGNITELDRGLLPIIPFYAPIRAVKRILRV